MNELVSKQIDYDYMEEQKVEVKPPWLQEGNRKYMNFMSKWKDMKSHIKSLFPDVIFKKVMTDKAFFYTSKDSKELYVCRKEVDGYRVEEGK